MTSHVVDVASLAVGDEIGSGGQAVVHRVLTPQWPNMLVKLYGDVTPDAQSLDALISWRGSLSDTDLEILDTTTSWPRARVVDGSRTIGVLIPEAPENFWIDVRGSHRLNELSYLVFGERSRKLGLSVPAPYVRAAIVASLVAVMELFDRHGVVHGDISFKNLLWTSSPSPACYLLDCDGVRLGDMPPALPHVTTQHWTDPRLQAGAIRYPDLESDRLSLALVFYRSYFQARGDFTGGRISLAIPDVPSVNAALKEVLGRALVDSSPRPAASEWSSIRRVISDRAADISADDGASRDEVAPNIDPLLEVATAKPVPVYSTSVDLVPDEPTVGRGAFAAQSSASQARPAVVYGQSATPPPTSVAAPSAASPGTPYASPGTAFTGPWISVLVLLFVVAAAVGFLLIRTFVT